SARESAVTQRKEETRPPGAAGFCFSGSIAIDLLAHAAARVPYPRGAGRSLARGRSALQRVRGRRLRSDGLRTCRSSALGVFEMQEQCSDEERAHAPCCENSEPGPRGDG